jgi:hypothetical protein
MGWFLGVMSGTEEARSWNTAAGRRVADRPRPNSAAIAAFAGSRMLLTASVTFRRRLGLTAFTGWLDVPHRSAAPKSLFGQAVVYARNQWASLIPHLDDGRFAIDCG